MQKGRDEKKMRMTNGSCMRKSDSQKGVFQMGSFLMLDEMEVRPVNIGSRTKWMRMSKEGPELRASNNDYQYC